MKNTCKKIISLITILVMVLSFCVTVFANNTTLPPFASMTLEEDTRTRQVGLFTSPYTNSYSFEPEEHQYTAIKLLDRYQAFYTDGNPVVYLSYPDDTEPDYYYEYKIAPEGLQDLATILSDNGFAIDGHGQITMADGTSILSNYDHENTSSLSQLASILANAAIDAELTGTSMGTSGYTSLECGYYVIYENKTSVKEDGNVATRPILVEVTDGDTPITISLKDSSVTLIKEIKSDNYVYTTADDHGYKDLVYYVIESNFPMYEVNAHDVQFVLHDEMEHQDLNASSIKVYVGSSYYHEDATGYALNDNPIEASESTYSVETNDDEFTIEFDSEFILDHQEEGVYILYNTILNDDAICNKCEENNNTATVTYTYNPEHEDDYATIQSSTYVTTAAIKFNKLDGADDSFLEGVEFELYMRRGYNDVAQEDYEDISDLSPMTFNIDSNGDYLVDMSGNGAVNTITTTDESIVIKGLGAGFYILHEKSTLPGYALPSKNPAFKIYTGRETTVVCAGMTLIDTVSGYDSDGDGKNDESQYALFADGSINIELILRNYIGISLPGTGSTAAIVMTVIGGAVAVAAIIILIIKRKKDDDDDEE